MPANNLSENLENLSQSQGYKKFLGMPLIGSITSRKKKEETQKENKDNVSVPRKLLDKLLKQQQPEPEVEPLQTFNRDEEILTNIYNVMRMDHQAFMKNMIADKKFDKKLESIKESRTKELIEIFAGKKKEREQKEKVKREIEDLKKKLDELEKKKEARKAAEAPAPTPAPTAPPVPTKAPTAPPPPAAPTKPPTPAPPAPVPPPPAAPVPPPPAVPVPPPPAPTAVVKPPVAPAPPTVAKAPEPVLPPTPPAIRVPPKIPTIKPPVVATGTIGLILSTLVAAGLSPKAQANVLAQIQSESNFVPKNENLNYTSAERIQNVFGKNRIPTLEYAQTLVKNPEKLAEAVYGKDTAAGKKLGNTEEGDGYKYRGRGFLQHTGKDQYKEIAKYTGIDVVNNPDLLNDPVIAAKAIPWFFLKYKGKKPEQLENITEVNKAVAFAEKKDDKTGLTESEKRKILADKFLQETTTAPVAASTNTSPNTGDKLDSASKENSDLKKKPSGSTPSVTVLNSINNVSGGSRIYETPSEDKNTSPVLQNQYK